MQDTPQSFLDTSLTDMLATTPELSARIIKAAQAPTAGTPTQTGSFDTTLLNSLKDGTLTPEEAVRNAFPSPFVRISDVSVEDLKVEVLRTGFKTLDDNFFLKRNRAQYVVVGALTSHGKTAFMMQIAAHVASFEGAVYAFQFEMDQRDLKARLLAPRISTPLSKIMKGEVPKAKLKAADSYFECMNLHVCTNGRKEVVFVRQACYDMAKKERPKLIICDYLQLMRGVTKATRTAEIAEINAELLTLAKEFQCPVMVGSQLNRELEKRGKKIQLDKGIGDYSPINSDLMDSSSLEHDADTILFIVRPYQIDGSRQNEADMYCTKNRGGKVFTEIWQYTGELCSFSAPGGGGL